ncbi:hypothetical protein GBA52_007259 [Prunus armeniaca]|nr:hypothetical protein GBA52_007259 [Prunus armeniaca]
MNDLSNAALIDHQSSAFKPIPSLVLYILVPIFFLGLSVSIFILIVVRNALFFISFLVLSALVFAFVVWNKRHWAKKAAFFLFLNSLPESDLRLAQHGQLVKITGIASCESLSLESSYEKATGCIYASTLLYEYRGLTLQPVNVNRSCFQWHLAYCERFSTDFYLTDQKSGLRTTVKAGSGCKVIPLVVESKLVNTKSCRLLSPHLRKWLSERNLSTESRLLRLEEGQKKVEFARVIYHQFMPQEPHEKEGLPEGPRTEVEHIFHYSKIQVFEKEKNNNENIKVKNLETSPTPPKPVKMELHPVRLQHRIQSSWELFKTKWVRSSPSQLAH